MSDDQKEAIKNFFKAAEELENLGIVRSSSYTGNIAEFICAELFDITLSSSQRERGLDGKDSKGRLVEIKYHNASAGTNIVMEKYKEDQNFQELIVILGPNSSLRSESLGEPTFEVYRINHYIYFKHEYITKDILSGNLKCLLNLSLDVIKMY